MYNSEEENIIEEISIRVYILENKQLAPNYILDRMTDSNYFNEGGIEETKKEY